MADQSTVIKGRVVQGNGLPNPVRKGNPVRFNPTPTPAPKVFEWPSLTSGSTTLTNTVFTINPNGTSTITTSVSSTNGTQTMYCYISLYSDQNHTNLITVIPGSSVAPVEVDSWWFSFTTGNSYQGANDEIANFDPALFPLLNFAEITHTDWTPL